MTAERHYCHQTEQSVTVHIAAIVAAILAGTIPVSALEALTASRLLVTSPGGVITPRAALTASRIVNSGTDGLLDVNAALTNGALVRAGASGALADNAGVLNADVGAAAAIAVSKLAALTASRALVSDASGFLSTSAITSTQLAAMITSKSDTARIALTIAANVLSADVVANSIGPTQMAAQGAGTNIVGSQATFSITSASYQDAASCNYNAPKTANSRVRVCGFGIYLHTSGTTTITLRRGTTVIAEENTWISTLPFMYEVTDTGHGGSNTTWNLSAKNTASTGQIVYGKVVVTDLV